jgi:hypothetical protein
MSQRRRYRRKPDQYVVAVQLKLDTAGFTYRKWGGEQRCKAGDWVVDSDGEVYTVDAESFARTYRQLRPGAYIKTAPVWAAVSGEEGAVSTKEGGTHHTAGDYVVSNEEDGSDSYAMPAERFHELYELDE